MSEEILKIIKKRNDSIFNTIISSSSSSNLTDYLNENALIGSRKCFKIELDYALKNNLIDNISYELVLNQFNESLKSKIKECSSIRQSFGSRSFLSPGLTQAVSDLSNLNIEDFIQYQNSSNIPGAKPPPNQKLDHKDFLDKNSEYLRSKASSGLKPTNFAFKPQQVQQFTNISNSSQANDVVRNNPPTSVNNEPQQSQSEYSSSPKNQLYKSNSTSSNSINTNTNYGSLKENFGNRNYIIAGSNNNSTSSNNISNNGNSNSGANSKFSNLKYEPSRLTKCYKRRNEDAEIPAHVYENYDVQTPFKSASEQLEIERAKKGESASSMHQQQEQPPQSLAKRPMTTLPKRGGGVHTKFNLPIRNNDDEANKANQQQKEQQQQQNNVPENLKNIDQKLIEIIQSEVMDRTPPISWDDIAGLDFVKKTIKEIVIWPMLRPDLFHGLRGPPKGLLLFGPPGKRLNPGTGKTLIAKCIANESKSTFFNISSSTLTSKWQGESEKLVKVLFEMARAHQPSVIFIDEIDSLLSQRSDEDRESSRRLKTEFFIQMDGAHTGADERILMIGATNRPQELDDAARRRFVKRLYIPLPEQSGRRQIIVNLMKKQHNSLTYEHIERISDLTDGYSGADMTNLCREAALGPIRSIDVTSIVTISEDDVRPVNYNDFIDAMKQVRPSVSSSDLDSYIKWNETFGAVPVSSK